MAGPNQPKPSDPAPSPTQTVTLTLEEIGKLTQQAAEAAVAKFQATILPQGQPQTAGPRRMTNAEFAAQGHDPGKQTQEDVAVVAATVGPASHYPGFVPHVPEVIAKRDLDAHNALIGRLEGMGYVVYLDRVEFKARWEPTESKMMGDKVVRARKFAEDGVSNPPEPKGAAPMLAKLYALDAQHSRLWLLGWQRGKAPSGDRTIDDMAAAENRQGSLAAIRGNELSKVESGSFSHLDNLGGEGLGMENQKLAPMEA